MAIFEDVYSRLEESRVRISDCEESCVETILKVAQRPLDSFIVLKEPAVCDTQFL